MSTKASREIDIAAPLSAVLETIADVEALPSWSSLHKKVTVVERTDDGKPKLVDMSISVMGVNDDQRLEYTWSDDGVTWDLVSGNQQKVQHAVYKLTEKDGGTHVFFEMEVDLKAPMPGFLVKRGTKSVLDAATEGLSEQVTR